MAPIYLGPQILKSHGAKRPSTSPTYQTIRQAWTQPVSPSSFRVGSWVMEFIVRWLPPEATPPFSFTLTPNCISVAACISKSYPIPSYNSSATHRPASTAHERAVAGLGARRAGSGVKSSSKQSGRHVLFIFESRIGSMFGLYSMFFSLLKILVALYTS